MTMTTLWRAGNNEVTAREVLHAVADQEFTALDDVVQRFYAAGLGRPAMAHALAPFFASAAAADIFVGLRREEREESHGTHGTLP